jgi:hypothetical protein
MKHHFASSVTANELLDPLIHPTPEKPMKTN